MTEKESLLHSWQELKVNPLILESFEKVPRENFVPPAFKDQAYHDHPLPTIRNQSISQPTTIMMMLQALELERGHNVFELGAGVGYQAALISTIVGESGNVVSVEVIPELVQIAKKEMNLLGITNAKILERDGSEGFSQKAPFDRIIITAACPQIPPPLIDQLANGGIIIAPVGNLDNQTMVKGVKTNGKLDLEFLGSFRFVPMKGKHGFKEVDLYNYE